MKMKLTTKQLKQIIREEIAKISEYGMYDQSMGAQMAADEEREFFSIVNGIKRDNPGISHEEAVKMAEEQKEVDDAESYMGMSQSGYEGSVSRGETMPVRKSKNRSKK